MSNLTLCAELTGARVSQYLRYNFNSLCKFGDVYLGAGSNGIAVLDDGHLDGTEIIDAFFELPTSDLGDNQQKRLRTAYLGCETNGRLMLTVKDDDNNERHYLVEPNHSGNQQHTIKVPLGRNGKGRYWMLRIENLNGADFSVDEIAVLPIILNRRPAGA